RAHRVSPVLRWTSCQARCGLGSTVVGTRMAKVSISIDDADLAWLKERAARLHGGNLSAALAEGTRLLRHQEALVMLLDDLGAPELSASELEALSSELDGRAPARRTKRRPAA